MWLQLGDSSLHVSVFLWDTNLVLLHQDLFRNISVMLWFPNRIKLHLAVLKLHLIQLNGFYSIMKQAASTLSVMSQMLYMCSFQLSD